MLAHFDYNHKPARWVKTEREDYNTSFEEIVKGVKNDRRQVGSLELGVANFYNLPMNLKQNRAYLQIAVLRTFKIRDSIKIFEVKLDYGCI